MKLPEDPFVLELLPEFVATWIDDIENQLPRIIATRNSEDLYRLAHTIKGSCFQFGLDSVAELGIVLMGYAKENNWPDVVDLQTRIRQSFIEVRTSLEAQGLVYEKQN